MLSANSTRDLNQSARAAAKYLQEQGIAISHAQALNLAARMVGSPHHMAAQAALSKRPADHAAAKAAGVIQDLCRVLAHPDIERAVYAEAVSDAANAALAGAAPYVDDEMLASFNTDALQHAYDDLPVGVRADELLKGVPLDSAVAPNQQALARRLAAAMRERRKAEAAVRDDSSSSFKVVTVQVPPGTPPGPSYVTAHKSKGHPMYSAECVRFSYGTLELNVTAENLEDAMQQALDTAYDTVFSMDKSDWYVSLLSLGGNAQAVPREFSPPEPMSQSDFQAPEIPSGRCHFHLRVVREGVAYTNQLHVLVPGQDLMDELLTKAGSASQSDQNSEYFVEVLQVTKA